jgi:hypothetical protein
MVVRLEILDVLLEGGENVGNERGEWLAGNAGAG